MVEEDDPGYPGNLLEAKGGGLRNPGKRVKKNSTMFTLLLYQVSSLNYRAFSRHCIFP